METMILVIIMIVVILSSFITLYFVPLPTFTTSGGVDKLEGNVPEKRTGEISIMHSVEIL